MNKLNLDALKECTKCGEFKPYTEFNRNKHYKDGWRTQCKKCISEYFQLYSLANKKKRAEYYLANKEKIVAHKRLYYLANRKEILESSRLYYLANKEKKAEYYLANKEKIAERKRLYYLKNKKKKLSGGMKEQ